MLPCCALLAFRCAAGAPAQQRSDEEKAQEYVAEAEALAARAEYLSAHAKYYNAMMKYPDTEGGRIARRRIGEGSGYLGCADLVRSGPSRNRVDVVIMGDGFELERQESFDRLARYVPDLFRQHPALGEYFAYHNFIRANLFSRETGVGGFGREKDTALRAAASDMSSGQVAVDAGRVYRWLAEVPGQERLAIVLVLAGSHGTGGSGIATIGGRPDQKVYHEWGHAFAGLADEYSTDVGYKGPADEAPNLATTDDPELVPWRHWLEAGVDEVGIHRGGGGRAHGTWKPSVRGCAMDNGREYCPVCREQIVLNIYARVDPIDDAVPPPHGYERPDAAVLAGAPAPTVTVAPTAAGVLRGPAPIELEVTVLQPDSHDLEVRWWVLSADQAPSPPIGAATTASGARWQRGPLPAIESEPAAETRANAKGRHRFTVRPGDLTPGLYRVICRARDSAKLPGERWPWVLKDPYGLLESERGWWLVVETTQKGG